jgi:hypothetical protein
MTKNHWFSPLKKGVGLRAGLLDGGGVVAEGDCDGVHAGDIDADSDCDTERGEK